MIVRVSTCVVVAALLVGADRPVVAAPKRPKYVFTKVEEPTDGAALGTPSINVVGAVAYVRADAPGAMGNPGIVVARGRIRQTIAPQSFSGFPPSIPSINSTGWVAFAAFPPRVEGNLPTPGVFSSRGHGVTTVLAPGTGYTGFGKNDDDLPFHVSINDARDVAFTATKNGAARGETYVGNGGPLTLLSAEAGSAAINAGGVVAYQEGPKGSGGPIKTTDGRTVAQIGSDYEYLDSATAINAKGDVAFVADIDADSAAIIVRDAAGAARTVVQRETLVDDTFGAYVAINASGTVAYQGTIAGEDEQPQRRGIFVGPDVVADAVILEGDRLFGSKVTAIGPTDLGPDAINDRGQIVFRYALKNGRKGIALATPKNAPPVFAFMQGDATNSPKPGKDTVSLKGTVPALGAAFDPTSAAAFVEFADIGSPVRIDVPAHDAGWKGRKGSWTWRSAKGAAPQVVLRLDAVKGTFSLTVSKFDLDGDPPSDFIATFSVGAVVGTDFGYFFPLGKGRFRYRL